MRPGRRHRRDLERLAAHLRRRTQLSARPALFWFTPFSTFLFPGFGVKKVSRDLKPNRWGKGKPMKTWTCLLTGAAVWLLSLAPAQAHFLFIHITPPAEGGQAAEVYFSEHATAGDPRFIEKISQTHLWQLTEGGKARQLTPRAGSDRLRAVLPEAGPVVVWGSCTYGVLARPNQTPFLLRYYPRAIAGDPEKVNRLQDQAEPQPVVIRGTVKGDQVELVLLHNGKPVPKAEFHTVDAALKGETLTADAEGRAVWKPTAPGRYSVYAKVVKPTGGEFGGKKYDEIREFPTLAFTWPLVGKGADAEAVALFEEAIAARASWKDFPGFTAKLTGRVDGRPIEGTLTVSPKGEVELETEEEAVQPWVVGQLESLVMHRLAPTGDRPKPVLRFAEVGEDHPLGRLLLFEGGRFASSYRVKDRQIMVVNRNLGKQCMTITILYNEKNADGRFLPHTYTVQYWDAATGDLQRTETFCQRWQRVGAWDLPVQHTVTEASANGLGVRSLTLSGHQLLKAK
jgi:hypothetical protein